MWIQFDSNYCVVWTWCECGVILLLDCWPVCLLRWSQSWRYASASRNHKINQCVTSLGHQTRWLCQVIPNQSAPFHSEGQCQDFLSLRWFAKIAAKIFHTNVVFALANQHTEWKFEIVAKNLTLGAFFNLIVQLKLNRSNENKRSHPTGKPICNLYDARI